MQYFLDTQAHYLKPIWVQKRNDASNFTLTGKIEGVTALSRHQ